jgi:DNA invertase Pin-like site-specific DNA recombinase
MSLPLRPESAPTVETAIYVRISADRAGDELGVRRQEKECRDLADQLGWVVAQVFADDDVSAFAGRHRPGYEGLLDAVRTGRVGAIVAWHPDRLHRSPKELEGFIDVVERHSVRVSTVKAGVLDLTTAAGRLTARIVGDVARHESEQKGERLKSKHDELRRRGRWSGGSRVYGYEPDGEGSLRIVKPEAKIIREATKRVLRGETPYSVVNDLIARGVPTATGKGSWRLQTLVGILKSGRNAALRTDDDGDVIAEAVWEPIITRAEWEALQTILRKPSKRGRRSRVALLAGGLVRCGRCGEPLSTLVKGEGRRTYRCTKEGHPQACGSLSVSALPLEEYVAEHVLDLLEGAKIPRGGKPDGARLADGIAQDERKLETLAGDFAADRITRKEWLAARDIVEDRLRENRSKLAGTAPDPLDGIADVRAAWETLDLDRRRAIVAAVIDRVVVQPTEQRGPRFDYDRVTFEYRA